MIGLLYLIPIALLLGAARTVGRFYGRCAQGNLMTQTARRRVF